jgi:hypothetical protein
MFNRKFKLIGMMVGMALLSVGLVMLKGMAQCSEWGPLGPGPCREQIVQGLSNAFAGFAASTEDLMNFEKAVLWSDGASRLIAYIPPHPNSSFLPLVKEFLAGEKVEVPLGGLWVGEDPTGFLPPGAYKMRLTSDEKVSFINSAGEEVRKSHARVDRSKPAPEKITFELTVVVSNPSHCWYVKIGPFEYGTHASSD